MLPELIGFAYEVLLFTSFILLSDFIFSFRLIKLAMAMFFNSSFIFASFYFFLSDLLNINPDFLKFFSYF
jgi:hypothetical protein